MLAVVVRLLLKHPSFSGEEGEPRGRETKTSFPYVLFLPLPFFSFSLRPLSPFSRTCLSRPRTSPRVPRPRRDGSALATANPSTAPATGLRRTLRAGVDGRPPRESLGPRVWRPGSHGSA